MSDLKPCPFCGGEAHLSADTSHSTAFFVSCETEDCFGLMMWAERKDAAIAALRAEVERTTRGRGEAPNNSKTRRYHGLASEALRAAGYIPLPRLWVTREQFDLIKSMAHGNADEVNRIRAETSLIKEKELAWKTHGRVKA